MSRYFRVLALALSVLLCGCATTKIGNTDIDDQGKYMQLEINESDKRDVYLVFGQPHYVAYDADQKSLWLYKRIDLTPSGWSYVPVVGLVVGGMGKDEKVAYFEFSSEGILKNVSSKESSGYVNQWVGIFGGGINDDEPEDSFSVKDEMSKYSLPYDEQRDPATYE